MIIEITNYRTEKTSATKLSWIQKLVCKLFKIEPVLKYHYRIIINENRKTGLAPSHIVVGADGNQLRALDENTLVTLTPLSQSPVLGNHIVVLYSAYYEGK